MTQILVINSGSSTIKAAIVNAEDGSRSIELLADRIGHSDASLKIKHQGDSKTLSFPDADFSAMSSQLFGALKERHLFDDIEAIGHRVVQGAEKFLNSTILDEEAINEIEKLKALAPLHNAAHVQAIREAQKHLPNLPQVAVFDTSFHQSLKEHAYLYPVPYEYYQNYGLRRYGAHGTSHRYVTAEGAKLLERPLESLRLASAHLGNGCSICAVANGESVDTSMGLTPLDGVAMGTRSGELDPSIHEFLAKKTGMNIEEITNVFNKKSGLLGLSSGLSNDMRILEDAEEEGNESAMRARAVFTYKIAKTIASYLVPLQGLDALIFTGGIGENDQLSRKTISEYLSPIGISLDNEKNAQRSSKPRIISQEDSKVKVLVIPTDEERMIAHDTLSLIQTK